MERTMEMSLFIIGGVRGGGGEFEYLWTKIREMQLIFFGFYYKQYMLLNTVLFSFGGNHLNNSFILRFAGKDHVFCPCIYRNARNLLKMVVFRFMIFIYRLIFFFLLFFHVFVSDKLFSPFHFHFSIFRLFVYIRFV